MSAKTFARANAEGRPCRALWLMVGLGVGARCGVNAA